jgi:hypothetical protein
MNDGQIISSNVRRVAAQMRQNNRPQFDADQAIIRPIFDLVKLRSNCPILTR